MCQYMDGEHLQGGSLLGYDNWVATSNFRWSRYWKYGIHWDRIIDKCGKDKERGG